MGSEGSPLVITPEKEKYYRQIFDKLDVDNDGRVDVDELKQAYRELGLLQVPGPAEVIVLKLICYFNIFLYVYKVNLYVFHQSYTNICTTDFHHTQTEGKNGLWQCAEIDGFPPNTQKFARIVFLRNILIEQGNETGLKMVLHQLVLRNFLNI